MENKIFFLSLSQTHLLMETNADTIVYSAPQTQLSGIEWDELYTTEEVFDELDEKLIEHYGNSYRQSANKRRTWWNQNSDWNFKQL